MHGCELVFLFVVLSTQSCLFYQSVRPNPSTTLRTKSLVEWDERIFSLPRAPTRRYTHLHSISNFAGRACRARLGSQRRARQALVAVRHFYWNHVVPQTLVYNDERAPREREQRSSRSKTLVKKSANPQFRYRH